MDGLVHQSHNVTLAAGPRAMILPPGVVRPKD